MSASAIARAGTSTRSCPADGETVEAPKDRLGEYLALMTLSGPTRLRALRMALPLFGLALLAGGCLPIPNLQVDLNVAPPSYRAPLDQVRVDYRIRPGYPERHTPVEFNRTAYLRYRLDPEPEIIVLLMPGIFGGAASFDALARQLVASTPGLEVWALDRRANLLEDRSAIRRSLAENDPEIAYDYYLRRWGKEEGFSPLGYEDVPFLRYWGLEVHLRDLHGVVLDARARAPRLILAGHSLGAALVSLYAAFEVHPAGERRYGYQYLDGLVLLDGALGRTGGFAREDIGFAVGPLRLAPSVAELERGNGPPFSTTVIGPRYQIEREVAAVLAKLEPEGAAPAGLAGLPMTNRALVGVRNDDEYGSVPIFSASLGHAVGAEFNGNLGAVILGGLEGLRSRSVVGVAPGHERVTWAPGDPERERTDLGSYVRAWTLPETNFAEWYFPLRLALDMTLLDPALEQAPGFLPNRLVTVPTLALGAGRGLVSSPTGMRTYANIRYGSPITAHVLPGLTHIDIISARANPVVPILQRWVAFFTRLLD
jgi:pimeloyl-ACP methyl ester carboxylesterase